MILEITGSTEIGLTFNGPVFLPFLNKGFSFATLQVLGKTPREIDRLQRPETGFGRMSAPSFKNLPESLPTPVDLVLLISCMIYKICVSIVPTRQKSAVIAKLEYQHPTLRVYFEFLHYAMYYS